MALILAHRLAAGGGVTTKPAGQADLCDLGRIQPQRATDVDQPLHGLRLAGPAVPRPADPPGLPDQHPTVGWNSRDGAPTDR